MGLEIYWHIISMVSGIFHIGAVGYLFGRFAEPYLNGRNKARTVGLSYFAVMGSLYLIPWAEIDGLIAYAAGAAAAFLAMCAVDRRNRKQKLFLTMIMYLLDKISSGVAIIPRGFLFEKIIYYPYVEQREWLLLLCYLLIEVFYVSLCIVIMAVLVKNVNKIYVYKKENMQGKELALMFATPFLAFTGYVIFLYFSNIWLETYEQYIWNVYAQYLWVKALYQIVSYAAILTTIVLYQNIKDGNRKEKENAVLSGQMEEMKKHISQMEAVYSDIRGLKHDMGNHVLTLEGLLRSDGHREAEEYLSGLKEQLDKIEEEIKTGNPVTDVILLEKQKEAARKGIDFVCDFHYPEGTNVSALDVSVILNNAVDNAVEAAVKCGKPYIHVKSWRQKNVYMLEIENSFDGKPVADAENGLPESTKTGEDHGFGLKNIQKVAGKYYGDIDIRREESVFILTVMLILE